MPGSVMHPQQPQIAHVSPSLLPSLSSFPSFLPCLPFLILKGRVSCSSGWLQTLYVVDDDLEHLILLPYLPSAGTVSGHYWAKLNLAFDCITCSCPWFCLFAVLEMDPRTLLILSNHSTMYRPSGI